MFENKQDTAILRDSLISATTFLQSAKESKEDCCVTDEEDAMQIVVSSVRSFICNFYGVDSFLDLFKNQQNINCRFHAVIFINLLKSQGITSSEASSFYQSVLLDLPILNWSFYLKLNFACHWSEYFIECAKELQPKVLSYILKKLLEVQLDGELKYYVWHLVLQTLISKTFVPHSSTQNGSNQSSSFQFQFSSHSTHSEVEDDPKNHNLPEIFKIILEKLSEESKENLNVHFLKVIFHGFKSIFKLVVTASDEDERCLEQLESLTPIFVKCLTQKTLICEWFSQCDSYTIGLNYQILSWEINIMYLMFVLQNSWKAFSEKSYFAALKSTPKKKDYCKNFRSLMKRNNLSYDILIQLRQECERNSETEKNYLILFVNIIKYHYPYASHAAEYLLTRPNFWEENNVLNLLEENVSLLEPLEIYSLFVDIIPKIDIDEDRERLLKIFFLVLSQAPSDIYCLALEKILKHWGYCDYFVTSDFDLLFEQFLRTSMSIEVENVILPLFVQSPLTVLKSLIKQVMKEGPDGSGALLVLKRIPIVCLYQAKIEDVPPLIDILSTYFQESSEMPNTKHFFSLVKNLMEMQVTEDILSFDLFFEICIIKNLSTKNLSLLEITLQCLNVALDVLISKHALEISPENIENLMYHLKEILDYCIDNGIGKLKKTVFNSLELISKYKKRPDLDILFYDKTIDAERLPLSLLMKEETLLYMLGIFCRNKNSDDPKEAKLLKWKNYVVKENLEYLWIWCTITGDTDTFVDKIPMYQLSYVNLLKTLTRLLWHSDMSEWIPSTNLIMYYLYLLDSEGPSYPWLFSNNDPELYGVVRCLLDCFSILEQERTTMNILFISGCLTYTIKSLINKANVPSSLLLNLFLDVCHLCSNLETELFYVFSSFLMNLEKQILKICDPSKKEASIKFMQLGLHHLPNSESLKENVTL